ncbi:discoidin domain-containing protein [Lentzea albida]|uniref:F5/8 type C domain-containing protein n=1 Tax=Lentzea albida TaxID=65499 RepID=A0A1H9SLQ3_9PSEU|nr:discoidin domain-containing protein [Lentzea albida]SER85655.1 F5/8 type C domain-containing protein [Lentzea albida]
MAQDFGSGVSRRQALGVGGGLLAGFGVSGLLARTASAAPEVAQREEIDLALFRPVSVSSTDYAATPGQFAVDGLAQVGVRGSGWRAGQGDGQWLVVDLQGRCEISSVVLTFEARPGDPAFDANASRAETLGTEVLSSYAVAFDLDVSDDGRTWRTVHHAESGTGGVVTVPLAPAVKGRWVRFSATRRSTTNPLGLNGLQVFGTSGDTRPAVRGWTNWPVQNHENPALTVAADGSVPLESGWVLTMADLAPVQDGAAMSGPGVDTRGWVPATVPGTVLASLVEQGHLPDPVHGMNNLQIPEALSRHTWWYRRTFGLPRGLDTSAGRHVWLEFDGINHEAEFWLNGAKIGAQSNPFGRAVIDVTTALKRSGDQNLAVKITPMPYPGSPGDKGPRGEAWVGANSTMFKNSPTYLAVSGWDWMPAVRDRASGIWNHVRLRSTGAVVVGDPRIDTVLPDKTTAEVTFTVPVRNVEATAKNVTVTAEFDGVEVSKAVTVPPNAESDVVFAPATHPQLRIRNPKLWWPNGYGEPVLHDLTLTATVGGAVSDRKKRKFGIRQVTYQYDLPITIVDGAAEQTVEFPSQQARYVRMQGLKRATNWGFSVFTMSVVDSGAPDTDLARGKTATASSAADWTSPGAVTDGDPKSRWTSNYNDNEWVQVDLGAATSFDRVVLRWETAYAATYKIQVSQDSDTWTDVASKDNSPKPLIILVNGVKIFARGGSWGWDELLRRMPASRADAAVALHKDMNFTMIRNWVGSSYREELFDACDRYGILLWNEFWLGWSSDPANHEQFFAQAEDTVLRYRSHPCCVVWFGCNEGSPPSSVDKVLREIVHTNTDLMYQPNSASGVITGDGTYRWVDPRSYGTGEATGGKFGFWSEIGLPTVSVAESMRNLVGQGNAGWPIGEAWYHHDWSENSNQQPNGYKAAIDARLAPSSSLEEFTRKAQFVNYENMRAIFEAWNSRLWNDATGVLLWMSHPAWHSTVWQTYDYDMDVNGSYYGSRKGCEQRHVQADPTTWQVTAVNHTAAALTGATVKAQLLGLDGKAIGQAQQQKLDVAATSASKLFTVPFDDALPAFHLLRLTLTDSTGKQLSENVYWRYRTPESMHALNQLAYTQLQTTLSTTKNGYTAIIRNTGRTVAAMVRLSLRERNGTDRVLPTLYSDNYFWLLPGEVRTVTIDPQRSVRNPRLLAEAYNSAPKLT